MGQTMGIQVADMDFSKLQIYANFLSQANYAHKNYWQKNTPEYRGITQEQDAGKELHPNKPYI